MRLSNSCRKIHGTFDIFTAAGTVIALERVFAEQTIGRPDVIQFSCHDGGPPDLVLGHDEIVCIKDERGEVIWGR